MADYLIKNCDIPNFDHLTLKKQDVLIKDNRFAKIADEIPSTGRETIINGAGQMLMPGFIDCHTHLLQSFCKGYLDDYPIDQWLVRLFRFESLLSEEDNYYAVLLSALEAIRFGTTTVNDMCGSQFADSTVDAILNAGIRATVGVSHTDILENEETPIFTIEQSLAESERLYKQYHNEQNGMIRISCAPAGLPACTKELMQALKAFCKERGLVFHTHLAEGQGTVQMIREATGWGEGEALDRYGLLDEHTLLAHSIWLDDNELDLIKKAGANPVYCPCTNLKISDGIPKIHQMLQRGTNVCIGCDGEASSSNRDLVLEAKIGSFLQKGSSLDPTAMNLKDIYKMMTVNGAKALGYEDIGQIKEGYKADCSLIETRNNIALTNQNTRLSNFIYAGTGAAVDTVFVDGRLLLHKGEFLSIDLEKLLWKCEKILTRIGQQVGQL